MAYLKIENIKIKGVSVCIPKNTENNMEYETVPVEQREKFVEAIGIEKRRKADDDTCTSDLCYDAALKLIEKLNWAPESIDLLIFISQTPDYRMPATSCLLQERLGLSKHTMTIDISQGCSGYIYGLGVAGSLLSSGCLKRCLLLVGNTQSKNLNYKDKSVYPLFSDAGSATALEYCGTDSDTFYLSYGTDGSGEKTIIIPEGGYRNKLTPESFVEKEVATGITRCGLNISMQGDDVFSFVIANVPKFTKELYSHFEIDPEKIDYFLIHHASMFIIKKLMKKLGLQEEKVPVILKDYGNLSNATIPMLMTQISQKLKTHKQTLYISGFGVGLSLGVGVIEIGPLDVIETIER